MSVHTDDIFEWYQFFNIDEKACEQFNVRIPAMGLH